MDKGVLWARKQIESALEISRSVPELNYLEKKISSVSNYFKNNTKTGDLYRYLKNFEDGDHKYAKNFEVFGEYDIYTNEKMSAYIEQHFKDEIDHITLPESFIIGETYSNYDIRNGFCCSYMGGMRKSNVLNALVLIAKHVNSLYGDKWINGILHYTGEGQIGDQSLTKQNKTLYNFKSNGVRLYLFEVYEESRYIYNGEMVLANQPYTDEEEDDKNNLRKVWKFPLMRKDGLNPVAVDGTIIATNDERKEKEIKKLTESELRKKLRGVDPNFGERNTIVKYRERDPIVNEFTKRRSKGICDLCNKEAPFYKQDGTPYLETHHVITLANKGPDQIYNTVALCPNCHKKMHILNNHKDLMKLTKVIYKYLLNENEKSYIEQFEKLFKDVRV